MNISLKFADVMLLLIAIFTGVASFKGWGYW